MNILNHPGSYKSEIEIYSIHWTSFFFFTTGDISHSIPDTSSDRLMGWR